MTLGFVARVIMVLRAAFWRAARSDLRVLISPASAGSGFFACRACFSSCAHHTHAQDEFKTIPTKAHECITSHHVHNNVRAR